MMIEVRLFVQSKQNVSPIYERATKTVINQKQGCRTPCDNPVSSYSLIRFLSKQGLTGYIPFVI